MGRGAEAKSSPCDSNRPWCQTLRRPPQTQSGDATLTGYVPQHDPSCRTRTYPTTCPECGMRVFFFSCSCQSAVFFESLGAPWPIHDRRTCSAARYEQLRRHGLSPADAGLTVHTEHLRRGRTVPARVAEAMEIDAKVEAARRAGPKKKIYRDVLPEENRDFVGTVMSLDRNINVPRHFGLPSHPITSGLLGRLGRGRWHMIRMRDGEAAAEQPIVAELSAFVSARDAADEGVREGQKLLISVEPWTPPGRDPVWVVTEITPRPG